jgi:hypothetical protein
VYYFGDNEFAQCGNGNTDDLNSVFKLNYFQNENLKIKKIGIGGCSDGLSFFLTGLIFLSKI